MVRLFPSIAAWRDDPIGDISGFNYYAIMRHARDNGVKVMLQGHGADEMCWGYPWVKDAVGINERGIVGLISSMRGSSSLEKFQGVIRHFRALRPADNRGTKMYELQPFTNWVIHNAPTFFSSEFLDACEWEHISSLSEYGMPELRTDLEINRLIVDYYLLGNGIAQGDRLSMANSVEVRLPFVDHKFVETIVGLRKTQRDDHLPTKYWLKESVRDLLGDEIINRPKRGFAPPVMRWQKELRKEYGHLLRDGYLVDNNILSFSAAERLTRQDIASGAEATVSRLALNLELWARGVILQENLAQLSH
jgi:asparagine synthase (glutamine-hydrolysing)